MTERQTKSIPKNDTSTDFVDNKIMSPAMSIEQTTRAAIVAVTRFRQLQGSHEYFTNTRERTTDKIHPAFLFIKKDNPQGCRTPLERAQAFYADIVAVTHHKPWQCCYQRMGSTMTSSKDTYAEIIHGRLKLDGDIAPHCACFEINRGERGKAIFENLVVSLPDFVIAPGLDHRIGPAEMCIADGTGR
jgi:hypothetical protein